MKSADFLRFLRARSRAERGLFWTLAAVLFVVLALLALTPSIGYAPPSQPGWIPEYAYWDLNPVLWFPYYAAGHSLVWIDVLNDPYGRTLPPQAFTDLLVETILFWGVISLALSRTVAWIAFRRRDGARGRTDGSPL